MLSSLPAVEGFGAPDSDCADEKLAPVIGLSDVTTSYFVAVPHSRSSPGAFQVSFPPDALSDSGRPGATASRPYEPEFALSWWKRGHDDGEQAGADVLYANT